MRLFLDANILFSAAWRDHSPASLLFRLGEAGFCELVTSQLALFEARRNLERKRPERLASLDQWIRAVRLAPEPRPVDIRAAIRHGLPAKDVPILAAALAARANGLVTGDRRDFGHLYGLCTDSVEVMPLQVAIDRLLQ